MSELLPIEILRYCDAHTSDEDAVLKALYRDTYLNIAHPQMISGKVQGQLLAMISRMVAPKAVLEIGTFTGYSTYCLSLGLAEGGRITTIEINEELEARNHKFFTDAGIAQKIEYITGDTLKIIPQLEPSFDLIFLDANKEHYPAYLPLCKQALKVGGFLVADNTLWGGKVAVSDSGDASSNMLDRFNKQLQSDRDFETVMLTVRDGLTLAWKKQIY